jgi:hypothetical protein
MTVRPTAARVGLQTLRILVFAFALPRLIAQNTESPKHEVGLTLGRLVSQDRKSNATTFELGSGTALQANYGYRFATFSKGAIYGEVHMLANPQRVVTSTSLGLTRDVASLFVAPGIRVKLFPRNAVTPYAAVGGGWALFEHSKATLAGAANPAPLHCQSRRLRFRRWRRRQTLEVHRSKRRDSRFLLRQPVLQCAPEWEPAQLGNRRRIRSQIPLAASKAPVSPA